MIAFVSLLLAFAATAGAIPLCRAFVRWLRNQPADDASSYPAPVAGVAILLGVLIALFYLGADPWPVLAGVIEAAEVSSGNALLAAMTLMTPMALILLGRAECRMPALPLGLALVQLLLLIVFGALVAPDPANWTPYHGFETLALPMIGALTAALIYLGRTPWREVAAISAGTATRLGVGLVVSCGALALGGAPWAQPERTAALLWILVIPLFELLHRYLVGSPRHASPVPGHTPGSSLLFALAAGAVGILLWHLGFSAQTMELALLPALLVYLSAPRLMLAGRRAWHAALPTFGGGPSE